MTPTLTAGASSISALVLGQSLGGNDLGTLVTGAGGAGLLILAAYRLLAHDRDEGGIIDAWKTKAEAEEGRAVRLQDIVDSLRSAVHDLRGELAQANRDCDRLRAERDRLRENGPS